MEKMSIAIDQATSDGLKSAMNCFMKFIGNDDIVETLCDENIFKEFGDYLLTLDYACGTMSQYLSGVFNSLKKEFPSLQLWYRDTNRDVVPKWYARIRRKIVRTTMQKVIEEGTKL